MGVSVFFGFLCCAVAMTKFWTPLTSVFSCHAGSGNELLMRPCCPTVFLRVCLNRMISFTTSYNSDWYRITKGFFVCTEKHRTGVLRSCLTGTGFALQVSTLALYGSSGIISLRHLVLGAPRGAPPSNRPLLWLMPDAITKYRRCCTHGPCRVPIIWNFTCLWSAEIPACLRISVSRLQTASHWLHWSWTLQNCTVTAACFSSFVHLLFTFQSVPLSSPSFVWEDITSLHFNSQTLPLPNPS